MQTNKQEHRNIADMGTHVFRLWNAASGKFLEVSDSCFQLKPLGDNRDANLAKEECQKKLLKRKQMKRSLTCKAVISWLSFVASSLNFLGECTTVECLEVTISKFELYSFCCIQQPVIAMAASSLLNFSMESLRCG